MCCFVDGANRLQDENENMLVVPDLRSLLSGLSSNSFKVG